ncbi:MAG: hypothetical protein ACOY0T_31335 [Myxococcota bacterium]
MILVEVLIREARTACDFLGRREKIMATLLLLRQSKLIRQEWWSGRDWSELVMVCCV